MQFRVSWNGWVRAGILFALKYVIKKVLTESGMSENLRPKSGCMVRILVEFYDFKETFLTGQEK